MSAIIHEIFYSQIINTSQACIVGEVHFTQLSLVNVGDNELYTLC